MSNLTIGGYTPSQIEGIFQPAPKQASPQPSSFQPAVQVSLSNDMYQEIAVPSGSQLSIAQSEPTLSSTANTAAATSKPLTVGDLNLESVTSQPYTLRQQAGIQSLSISGEQNQAVLDLLR